MTPALDASERATVRAHFRRQRRAAALASDFAWYRATVQAERDFIQSQFSALNAGRESAA